MNFPLAGLAKPGERALRIESPLGLRLPASNAEAELSERLAAAEMSNNEPEKVLVKALQQVTTEKLESQRPLQEELLRTAGADVRDSLGG